VVVVWSALQAKTLVGVSAGEGPNRGHPRVRGQFRSNIKPVFNWFFRIRRLDIYPVQLFLPKMVTY